MNCIMTKQFWACSWLRSMSRYNRCIVTGEGLASWGCLVIQCAVALRYGAGVCATAHRGTCVHAVIRPPGSCDMTGRGRGDTISDTARGRPRHGASARHDTAQRTAWAQCARTVRVGWAGCAPSAPNQFWT